MDVIKWGLISCANIANKNVRGMELSKNSKLVAVASRNIEKAKSFAADNNLSESVKLYASYQELLDDPNVDAVYLPLPTTMHLEWGVKVAKAGKHLLIEKPAAVDAAELLQIIEACNENKVLYMDGVMFMHHDRTNLLRSCLRDPFAGEVQRVNASFSFNGTSKDFSESNIRVSASGDPLGALGDLGWYCIRLGLIAFSKGRDNGSGSESNDITLIELIAPVSCSATCNAWADKVVPLECDATVYFSADKKHKLTFDVSFLLPFRQRYEISAVSNRSGTGDKVYRCDDFVIPSSQLSASFVREISGGPSGPLTDKDTNVVVKSDVFTVGTLTNSNTAVLGQGQEQETNMFTVFSQLCREHENGGTYWSHISLVTQNIIDACLKSMNNGGVEVPVNSV